MNGHDKLIAELENLLEEAKNFEFHDFKNDKYPAPKIALRQKLVEMAARVITGDYDNEPV